eukprot:TRINITY_DN15665_c0_g1_i1.p1 TRINITY_DN15665_c0_g1~~TRINITY_DN15665_c0_g1_i1.p1  ORF type:complete len:306 (-),score=69.16 TRINITY_DN15665_c0_g1_i1:99-1016(-)
MMLKSLAGESKFVAVDALDSFVQTKGQRPQSSNPLDFGGTGANPVMSDPPVRPHSNLNKNRGWGEPKESVEPRELGGGNTLVGASNGRPSSRVSNTFGMTAARGILVDDVNLDKYFGTIKGDGTLGVLSYEPFPAGNERQEPKPAPVPAQRRPPSEERPRQRRDEGIAFGDTQKGADDIEELLRRNGNRRPELEDILREREPGVGGMRGLDTVNLEAELEALNKEKPRTPMVVAGQGTLGDTKSTFNIERIIARNEKRLTSLDGITKAANERPRPILRAEDGQDHEELRKLDKLLGLYKADVYDE